LGYKKKGIKIIRGRGETSELQSLSSEAQEKNKKGRTLGSAMAKQGLLFRKV
jgi:hypothetical protein